ncbi:MAG: toll/interleukin-1 receptor domain-containing protein [Hyphomonadaceae bacterium]
MSDVYISCVEEDADFVRRAANTLRADGWNVWCNPSLAAIGDGEADLHLNGAGAVLVVWSANSRSADHLRSEAATGMYRNKLVQVRLDASAPPRPFDQADTFDLQSWNGDHADPNWQRLLQTLALFAGAPGVARPQVVRGAGAGARASRRNPAHGPARRALRPCRGGASPSRAISRPNRRARPRARRRPRRWCSVSRRATPAAFPEADRSRRRAARPNPSSPKRSGASPTHGLNRNPIRALKPGARHEGRRPGRRPEKQPSSACVRSPRPNLCPNP